MASIDLEDLIEDLVVELNVPGLDIYDSVSADEWVIRLRNGFWNAHLDGLMNGWTEADGFVSALNNPSAPAMTRDQQQVIIIYTIMGVMKNNLIQLNLSERYQAGPVEYEVQKSAQLFKALMDEMASRLKRILDRLADDGRETSIYYTDTYVARQEAFAYNYTRWIGN